MNGFYIIFVFFLLYVSGWLDGIRKMDIATFGEKVPQPKI